MLFKNRTSHICRLLVDQEPWHQTVFHRRTLLSSGGSHWYPTWTVSVYTRIILTFFYGGKWQWNIKAKLELTHTQVLASRGCHFIFFVIQKEKKTEGAKWCLTLPLLFCFHSKSPSPGAFPLYFSQCILFPIYSCNQLCGYLQVEDYRSDFEQKNSQQRKGC